MLGATIADTNTQNLKLVNQTEGGNSNSWGGIADANFEEIDDKFGDVTSISTTGGTTTLTDSQEIVNAIVVTGTLASNATIVFSGRGGTWVIKNGTSGSYTLTCKVSGQTGVEIEQGAKQTVFCNGTDIETAGGPSNATETPTGALNAYVGTTAPSGWVRANGRTIGNASSSATERANADTETLFNLLWDSFSNTILVIQDSAGTPTSRGVSAAIDYAANKRLPLPDLRGRALFGLDDMGNTAASRLGTIITTATTNGASGGTETHTLTMTEMPAHTHTGPSHTHSFSATTGTESAAHTHSASGTTGSGSSHAHTILYSVAGINFTSGGNTVVTGIGSGSGSGATQAEASHTHSFTASSVGTESANHTHSVSGTTGASGTGATGSSGSDGAHSNMPPAWLITFIIKL